MTYNSIRPGELMLDTEGKPIQAHGLSMLYSKKDNLYYWYGENKEFTKKGGKIWHYGVRCYSSPDFYNWTDRGIIIPPSEDIKSPLHPNHQMDRPHIIYCEKTGKYVAWLKIMAGGDHSTTQFMTVMQADNFMGPYVMVHEIYSPCNMDSGDFTLIEDDGKAYIMFERPHFELICATLSDTYTETTGEYSVHYGDRKPPLTREAPVFFRANGKKYLFTSGTSGYYPNRSTVCMIDSFHKEYTDLGDPCIGDKSNTTFNSQISCVIKIPDRNLYVALADRWLPSKFTVALNGIVMKGMTRAFKNYVPDRSPVTDIKISEKEKTFDQNTSKSRYVFLPVEFEGEKPVIKWKKEWKIEDYN